MSLDKIRLASKFNAVWRRVAQNLSRNCVRCGRPRLYSVLDAYITGKKLDCIGCSTAYRTALPLVKRVFGRTNLSEEDVKELMGDALMRRSMLNVVRGIGHFGLMAPQPTAVPVVIVWNYTNRCNLSCIHCHQDSGDAEDSELTTEKKFELIDRLGDAGISIVTFSGGEPLVCPDIFEAVRRASDSGILCTIASNATLMTRDTVRKLKESGIRRVEIGLDGYRAETHDFLRNHPGSFEATVQGIRNCAEAGFDELCATMTLHSKNVNELRGTITLAEKLGVDRFYLNRLIPAGRGRDVIHLDITDEQRIEALEYAYEKFHDSAVSGKGIQPYCRGMTYYDRLGHERSDGEIFTVNEALSGYSRMWRGKFSDRIQGIVKKFASGFGGCSAGITYAGLTAGGDLLPCVPAPMKLGNLLEKDLEEIWVNSELLNYMRRRDELQGACGACAYKNICGGCRYTAYAINGDWLAADPSCPYAHD